MVDQDIVASRLKDLTERVRRARLHCPPTAEELAGDQDALDLVSFNLLLAIQACLDIASHLIADAGWQLATTSAESFQRLHEHGVISKPTAEALGLASGLRNVVAHAYATVQVDLVHKAATEELGDLERFAREISSWVRRLGEQ